MSRNDLKWGALLFIIWAGSFFLFYALNSGLTCTNDGSHFAFIKALDRRGDGKLGDEIRWARHDSAKYKDEYYSDRHPGTAFVGLAFLRLLSHLRNSKNINHGPAIFGLIEEESLRDISILMLLPALAGSLLLIVLVATLRLLGFERCFSVVLACSFMFSTLLLRYSTVLYSHILAALFVSISFLLLLKYTRSRQVLTLFTAAMSFAFAALVEHISIVLLPALLGYLLMKDWRLLFGWRQFGLAVFGFMLPLAPFFIYNYNSFDNPFCIAHFHHSTWGSFHTPRAIFPGRDVARRIEVLFFARRYYVSLFGSAVHLLLLVLLPFCFFRSTFLSSESKALLIGVICGVVPIFFASSNSGWDLDYRHILFVLPFFLLLWSLVLRELLSRINVSWAQWVTMLGILISAVYSAYLQFDHIRHSRQPFMPGHLYNVEAAVYNVLPIVGVVGVIVFLKFASSWIHFNCFRGLKCHD